MSFMDIVDFSNNDGVGAILTKTVKSESDLIDNRSSSASVLDQEQSPADDSNLCSTSPICAAPLVRQFWKAGNYNDVLTPKSSCKSGSTYLHIHPKFLHSNATSHKWAFGAIAELVDNAIDEIQNGATFVLIDKAINPRNGSSAFLIQDDGGGMDPDAMRRCLSFGFSDKKSNLAIGQYGNGFKTSSMRLGADVIVFSRNMQNRTLTQSIGLLSYTFLTQTGHDRIVVPMVDYEYNAATGAFDPLHKENYATNLSILLQWSPYSSEEELLQQFDSVSGHGTKAIIYNLWFSDEGTMELDFNTDPEDIRIIGEDKSIHKSKTSLSETLIANCLRYSLRAYLSVLYLKLPETFCILLRGQVVEYHNIATDLKYPEFILYKPQSVGTKEAQVVTTIGFLKEAPEVNVHGFNVYHKNRLILPFWPVVRFSDSRGRGVVGILEANFVEPTHSKQDFEKTSAFQKLECRLKEMTWEYWDHHCGLLGYMIKKKPPVPSDGSSNFIHQHGPFQPVNLRRRPYAVKPKEAPTVSVFSNSAKNSFNAPMDRLGDPTRSLQKNYFQEVHLKRKEHDESNSLQKNYYQEVHLKRKERDGFDVPDQSNKFKVVKHNSSLGATDSNFEIQPLNSGNSMEEHEAMNVIQENKRLREQCLEYEKTSKELEFLAGQLKSELLEAQGWLSRLLAEARSLEKVKGENEHVRWDSKPMLPYPSFVAAFNGQNDAIFPAGGSRLENYSIH